MNSCQEIRELFVQSLYEDISETSKALLEEHRKNCPDCAAECAEMEAALKIMDERKRPEPDPLFWDQFDSKLRAKLEAPAAAGKGNVTSFQRAQHWIYRVAAAIILIGLGIAIDRYYTGNLVPTIAKIKNKTTQGPLSVQTVSTDAETKRFLERSEVLLLGVVNADPSDTSTYAPDFARQKQLSRELVHEASFIQDKLKDSRQRRLRGLVSDLQLILLQISNLELEQDQPEIEIVKSGVSRKGLLLKIDLEQLRLSDRQETAVPEQTSGKPRI